jgi:thiol-disulfide isomerase/thioredoxin
MGRWTDGPRQAGVVAAGAVPKSGRQLNLVPAQSRAERSIDFPPMRFLTSIGLALTLCILVTPPLRAADESPALAVGTVAPDFVAYKPDGGATHLSDYSGKVVLVDFWATWCGPCRAAMPRIEALHQKLHGAGLVVLGVCVADEKSNFDAWQKAPKVATTYSLLYDQAGRSDDSAIMDAYHLSSIPTFYLIGKDGKILFTGMGADDETEQGLTQALQHAGFSL